MIILQSGGGAFHVEIRGRLTLVTLPIPRGIVIAPAARGRARTLSRILLAGGNTYVIFGLGTRDSGISTCASGKDSRFAGYESWIRRRLPSSAAQRNPTAVIETALIDFTIWILNPFEQTGSSTSQSIREVWNGGETRMPTPPPYRPSIESDSFFFFSFAIRIVHTFDRSIVVRISER